MTDEGTPVSALKSAGEGEGSNPSPRASKCHCGDSEELLDALVVIDEIANASFLERIRNARAVKRKIRPFSSPFPNSDVTLSVGSA